MKWITLGITLGLVPTLLVGASTQLTMHVGTIALNVGIVLACAAVITTSAWYVWANRTWGP